MYSIFKNSIVDRIVEIQKSLKIMTFAVVYVIHSFSTQIHHWSALVDEDNYWFTAFRLLDYPIPTLTSAERQQVQTFLDEAIDVR